MRYDLSRLGDQEFEDLSQTLAACVLGSNFKLFGDGPSGGLGASFEGEVRCPDLASNEVWNGLGVVTAKYRIASADSADDLEWFSRQVKNELDKWASLLVTQGPDSYLPQYILFTTNLEFRGRRHLDAIDHVIKQHTLLQLKGWALWHQQDLWHLLDAHADVRQMYAGFITPGDTFGHVHRILSGDAARLGSTMSNHAAKEMIAQQYVRLSEAGATGKLFLSSVAVDLPARVEPASLRHVGQRSQQDTSHIAGEIITRGNRVRRARQNRSIEQHFVIVGGPGQGKSTLGQLVCQAYRVALLSERTQESLGPEASQALEVLRDDLLNLGLPVPACRRWPIQIGLSKFGDAVSNEKGIGVLAYLSATMSGRIPVSEKNLRDWLAAYPWLLVLDGLDEVSAPSIREQVMNKISDFLIDAAELKADLLIVATTRPQGYTAEFAPNVFEHWNLQPLGKDEALNYAKRLAAVRHVGDPDFHDQVVERVSLAADQQVTARMMRSPLQVTIMSLLLERRVRVPQDRYGLFEAYYSTLYEREISKGTPIARLLDEQRRNVDHIHETVGLLLHIRAYSAGEAESRLKLSDLRELALYRLESEGYAEAAADGLADQLIQAATDRLVMLAAVTADHVGFEIRSLQELMAARALTSGEDQQVVDLLRDLAPSVHWRNTWLFAVSRLFAQREHLRDSIIRLLTELDTASVLQMTAIPGARLAIDMLDEDIAAQAPLYRRLLAARAMDVMNFFPGDEVIRLASALRDVASVDRQTHDLVENSVTAVVATMGRSALTSIAFLQSWMGGSNIDHDSRLKRLEAAVPPELRRLVATAAPNRSLTETFRRQSTETRPSLLEPAPTKLRNKVFRAIQLLEKRKFDQLTKHLDSTVEAALVSVIQCAPPEYWPATALLREMLIAWHETQPVVSKHLDAAASARCRPGWEAQPAAS